MFASLGIGSKSCRALLAKERTLGEILQMVLLLKGEIRYGNVTLREACLEVSDRMDGVCEAFLKSIAEGISSGDFGELFAGSVDRYLKTAGLTREELSPLYLLGRRLGYLDAAMQMKQLELCEESFRQILSQLQRELPQKQKLYRSLGILGGLMLVLLLW